MDRPPASAAGGEDRERSRSPRASDQDLSEEETWEDSAHSRTEEDEVPALGADQRQPWGDGHWWLGLSPQFPRYPLDPLARSRVNLEASDLNFTVVVDRWTILHYLVQIKVANGSRGKLGGEGCFLLCGPTAPCSKQQAPH